MTLRTETPIPSRSTPRPGPLRRLADWSRRHHWTAAGLWLLVLVAVSGAAQAVGSDYHDDTSLPGTESQRVADLYAEHAPQEAGDSLYLVVTTAGPVTEPGTRRRVEDLVEEVAAMPHVASVADPFEEPGAVADDSRHAYVTVTLDATTAELPAEDVRDIVSVTRDASDDDLRVAAGGDPVRATEEAEGGGAEGIGMLAALVILVLMFGSLLAASLPLVTAVLAVGSTVAVIALLSHVVDVASYTTPLMMLVGLGVGVDYALLLFARYRSELRAGADSAAATVTALDTAGRSVLFAGATVIVALLGLFLTGVGSLEGVALAVALTVLVTMLAAITLLPALLGIFGRRIETRLRRRDARTHDRTRPGAWERWARLVQSRPWPALLGGVVVLVVLCVPALDLRLGFADAGAESPSLSSRQAYDAVAEGFGPGHNGPLVVLGRGGADASGASGPGAEPGAEPGATLEDVPGVDAVTPSQPLGDSGWRAMLVFPTTAPQDEATTELVHRLRDDVLPDLAQREGGEYLVGGSTAAAIDFSGEVAERLPLFILLVVGVSALLLTVVFRSLLIPLKAAALNLLSIGAALGVMVVVFQHGSLGVQPGPIEAFVPVLVFAIVFGLSMDYEVFLVSRMHEAWRAGADPHGAVRTGLVATAGVITAAGAIMVVVFGAFLLSPDRMLQQFGLGLAVAVLVDAVVIRTLVVPSVMHLLGRRAWWLPRRLDAVLPSLPLEAR